LLNKKIIIIYHHKAAFWLVGNVVGCINEVNQRLARLVLGWVTTHQAGKQTPGSTQPGRPSMGRSMGTSKQAKLATH